MITQQEWDDRRAAFKAASEAYLGDGLIEMDLRMPDGTCFGLKGSPAEIPDVVAVLIHAANKHIRKACGVAEKPPIFDVIETPRVA